MTVPYVLEKTSTGERVWDIWSILNRNRVVFLGEDIDDRVANSIIAQLLYLESDNPDEPITIFLNTNGGEVSAGLSIVDVMNYVRPDVHVVCVGKAASMGAVILSAGKKGHRHCLPNGSVLIHQPSGGVSGQATDIFIQADRIRMLKDKLIRILSENTGQTYEKVANDAERDFWLSAADALEYGIVDKILYTKKTEV